jgi:hypothetical protein
MSYFYGWLQGNRGETTRGGSEKSGISATLQSWQNRIRCSLSSGENNEDVLTISASHHDSSSNRKLKVIVEIDGKEVLFKEIE